MLIDCKQSAVGNRVARRIALQAAQIMAVVDEQGRTCAYMSDGARLVLDEPFEAIRSRWLAALENQFPA